MLSIRNETYKEKKFNYTNFIDIENSVLSTLQQ